MTDDQMKSGGPDARDLDDDASAAAATETAAPHAEPAGSTGRRSGRPILGAIAGFLLGLFLWIDFVLMGVVRLESVTFWIFPVLGLIAGIALARWAPFGRARPV